MTDPVPSNSLVAELRAVDNRPDFAQIYLRHLCLRAAAEIVRMENVTTLRDQIDGLMAEVSRLAAENFRICTVLRGISTCSTCEACRGAATLALGGATPEPAPVHGGRIMTLAECIEAEGGIPFVGMEPNTDPLTHQEIFSAVHHHASEIVRLTAAVPAQCSPQPPRDGQG